MEVRKYLFWMTDKGIQTYKVTNKGTFELVRFKGEDKYTDTDFSNFVAWFNRNASIAEDEYIDFCYLSDKPVESSLFRHSTKTKSSWDKKEISIFCDRYINADNYEVIVDEQHSFICQNGNVFNKDNLKKIYLKCVPEFSLETVEKIEQGSEETSLVNRYFIDKLNELEKQKVK